MCLSVLNVPLLCPQNGRPVSGAMGPKPFDKGVSRELALVLGPGDNMATYQCEADNEAGVVMSAETHLQVLCRSNLTCHRPFGLSWVVLDQVYS